MKYFTADLHLDHAKVLVGERGRCFPTIEQWSDHILAEINRVVKPADTLYILGDFAFKRPDLWRAKIRCGDVWLIVGNHDPSQLQLDAAFGKGKARLTYETHVCETPCFLSHYAHAFWPKSHHGACHLYGHNHGQRESTLNEWMPQRRSMDVCPEVVYRLLGEWRPISEEEIHARLSLRTGHDPVSFYEGQLGQFSREADHAPTP